MRLPLYKEFENYEFRYNLPHNSYFKNIVRAYNREFFAFLMQDYISNTTKILIYALGINQHNSFVFATDVTQ